MRHQRLRLLTKSALTLLAATLGLASSAYAAEFGMSGTLTLIGPGSASPIRVHEGTAIVSADATTIPVPANVFTSAGLNFRVFPGFPGVAQLTSSFSSTHAAHTLMAGGGPGSFAFCPQPGNPVNPNCTNPAQGQPGFNNLVQYTAGANQFGGSFRLIRKIFSSSVSSRVATAPLQFLHAPVVPNSRPWPAGVTASVTQLVAFGTGVITQSPVLGPSGSISVAGPIVNPSVAPNPSYFETGFPLTTGMIVQKDTDPVAVTFSITGSNTLTPSGSGMITLVAGAVAGGGSTPPVDFQRQTSLTITLPEPGVAASVLAGIVPLLALGWFKRRRSQG